jgi:hypothetical protein
VTTILELLGMALLVAGFYLALGLAAALMLAGTLFLALSYAIERSRPRKAGPGGESP